ncbi:hypothetical protein Hanom_Chr11g01000531 [Helianthus anomalus]
MGLIWLSSWLNELYSMSLQNLVDFKIGSDIMDTLAKTPFILTNHGFVIPSEVAVHFNNDFGNHIDIRRLISGINIKWYEVDKSYLKYSSMRNWRIFLKEVGVTGFVIPPGSTVSDWDSQELFDLLANVSLSGDREKCKYLLKVFDKIWDAYFSDKVEAFCNMDGEVKSFKGMFGVLDEYKWVVSSLDARLCYPQDLFYHCEAVCSIFGDNACYAIPKVNLCSPFHF